MVNAKSESNVNEEARKRRSDQLVSEAEQFWGNSNKTKEAAETTMSYIEKAINLDPLNIRAWADKGFILKQQGEYDRALMCLDRALALNKDSVNPLYNKAVLLGILGKYQESLNCFNRLLAVSPDHALGIRDRNLLLDIIAKEKK